MTKTILTVGTHELTTARVRCNSCGIVVEVPLSKLGSKLTDQGSCRHCGHDLTLADGPNPFAALALAISKINENQQAATVEFVIPVIPETPK